MTSFIDFQDWVDFKEYIFVFSFNFLKVIGKMLATVDEYLKSRYAGLRRDCKDDMRNSKR